MQNEENLSVDIVIKVSKRAYDKAAEREDYICWSLKDIYTRVETAQRELAKLMQEIGPVELKEMGIYGKHFNESSQKIEAAREALHKQRCSLNCETARERENRIKQRAIRYANKEASRKSRETPERGEQK